MTARSAGRADLGSRTHVVPGMTEEQTDRARRLDAPTVAVVILLLVILALLLHFSNPEGALLVVSYVLNWFIYGWFLFSSSSTCSGSPRTTGSTSAITS